MNMLKIYLDTSVISHLDAKDTPEKMADTLRLWELLEERYYSVVLSDIVFDELEACEENKRKLLLGYMKKVHYEMVSAGSDVRTLARKFISFEIPKEQSFDDCRHIAAALVAGCDVIASWNFRHIVNVKTIRGAKIIAALEGFKDIIVCTPTLLIEGGIDNV
ncbi:MAG: PIN domain nuclease [Dehalococcoidia bacterium]|nr:PIN domain nuclease [Dehalococcoidia bacterium]